MPLQAILTDRVSAWLILWLITRLIIRQAPQERSHVGRCTSKRSPKARQNPTRLNRHQALHAQTWTIWIEVTDFLYTSLMNTWQRSRPLRQYPRSSRKPQKGPAPHASKI